VLFGFSLNDRKARCHSERSEESSIRSGLSLGLRKQSNAAAFGPFFAPLRITLLNFLPSKTSSPLSLNICGQLIASRDEVQNGYQSVPLEELELELLPQSDPELEDELLLQSLPELEEL
jgi:hypothetical protein